MVTAERIEEIKLVLQSMLDVIQAAGPTGIPSGHFYAQLMGYMKIDQYQTLIDLLIKAGRVQINNHVLTYVEREEATS